MCGWVPSPKHFIKRRMGQKVFDFIRMGLRTGCPKISAGMLTWLHYLTGLTGARLFCHSLLGSMPRARLAMCAPELILYPEANYFEQLN